jgi:hypothetical protein
MDNIKIEKLLIPLLSLLLSSTLLYSQERKGSMGKPFILSQQFKHSAGIGASIYRIKGSSEPVFHLDYNPSLSITRSWSDFSVSIGSQLAAGYHIKTSVDDSAFIFADLPLIFEFNFGHNASKDFYSDVGWLLGAGYTYTTIRDAWQHGPLITAGARGFLFGPSITVRYSHFFPVTDDAVELNNISLLLNLGNYFEQVKLNNKVSRFK